MKFLVVEDKAENREAANKFFASQGIEVEFAETFQDGEKRLDNEIEQYDGAIIDLELPVPGGCIEKVGYFLAQKAKNYGLPCVLLSAGIHHHGPTSAVFDEDEIQLNTGPSKENPEAYKVAFDTLLNLCPCGEETLEEIFVSRKRYKERVGKQYQRRSEF